jgi:hypothetical protein
MNQPNHHTLVAVGAIAIGFTMSQAMQSSPAQGYPMGAVSLGVNPIDMAAGTASSSPATVFTASAEHDFVVTDVILTLVGSSLGANWNSCTSQVTLLNSTGDRLGSFQLQTDQAAYYSMDPGSPASIISHTFSSGLVVSAGDTMALSRTGSCGVLDYTLSGYHAQQ